MKKEIRLMEMESHTHNGEAACESDISQSMLLFTGGNS